LGLFVKFVFPLLLDVVDNDMVDRKDEWKEGDRTVFSSFGDEVEFTFMFFILFSFIIILSSRLQEQ
jgi:hypothetical protein